MRTKDKRKTAAQHRIEAHGYMMACTDAQLFGVIEAEKTRIQKAPLGQVARVANIMLDEAQKEMAKRGLS